MTRTVEDGAPREEPLLGLRDVTKAYRRRPVVADVSLGVGPGEAVAALGRNGAGKSTLLAIAGGQRPPDRGTVRIAGEDPFRPGTGVWAVLGYVPESPHLYPDLTVGEHLEFVAAVRGLDGAAPGRAEELLEAFGIEGARGRPVRELSRGMARKTALILGLLHDPGLIILDEPFTGLDADSEEALAGHLRWRLREGAGLLLASHRLDFLAELCHRGVALHGDGSWELLAGRGWREWTEAPALPDRRGGPEGR